MESKFIESAPQFERHVPSDIADGIGLETVRSIGLTCALRRVGSHVLTAECSLMGGETVVARGLGKGLAGQEVTSAIFEALEHHFYGSERLVDRVTVRDLDLSVTDAVLLNFSPDFRLICGNATFPISRLTFEPLSEGFAPVYIPAFLFNPDFTSHVDAENQGLRAFRLLRYSTNSGTAAGVTVADARLHALLELIERDAVSIELLRTVISEHPLPVRRLLTATLPVRLQFVCELSTSETGLLPVLFDITSDLGIPSILCMLTPPTQEGRSYFGAGTSLLASYAAERAILEAIQTFHCHRYLEVPEPEANLSVGRPFSRYHRCFLNAGIFAYRGGETNTSFGEITEPVTHAQDLSPDKQVAFLTNTLTSAGYSCFARTIFSGPMQVQQTVIPGLEHFNLVSYGIPVAPGARGRSLLARLRS